MDKKFCLVVGGPQSGGPGHVHKFLLVHIGLHQWDGMWSSTILLKEMSLNFSDIIWNARNKEKAKIA